MTATDEVCECGGTGLHADHPAGGQVETVERHDLCGVFPGDLEAAAFYCWAHPQFAWIVYLGADGEVHHLDPTAPIPDDAPTIGFAEQVYVTTAGNLSELIGELGDQVPSGPDAADVFAALDAALELAEVWLIDGVAGTLDDRLRLYRAARDWQKRGGRLATVVAAVEDSVLADLDAPREVDGQWYRAHRTPRRTGFDKPALRSAVNRTALAARTDVDPDTGEVLGERDPSPAEVADAIWRAADVATGRSKVLREQFGIDLDEYATTDWRAELQPIDFTDLPPDEQAKLTTDHHHHQEQ